MCYRVSMEFNFIKYDSPVGGLFLTARDSYLYSIIFEKNWKAYKQKLNKITEASSPILLKTQNQLTEYFEGRRKTFDLNCDLEGTDFQKKVWQALARIPYGETKSYKEQAEMIKSPNASRAVGRANGLNPICIVYPCHRVIGTNRTLTGYAGGINVKEFLLNLEGIQLN